MNFKSSLRRRQTAKAALVTVMLAASGYSWGQPQTMIRRFAQGDIQDELSQLQEQPELFRVTLPLKKGGSDFMRGRADREDNQRSLFLRRSLERKNIMASSVGGQGGVEKSQYEGNDRVEDLLESARIVRSLGEMQDKNLLEGMVESKPWSDTYWPIYRGMLGARYADEAFNSKFNWPEAKGHIEKFPALTIIKGGDAQAIDLLSPSEKYDFLLSGDKSSLTDQQWAEGKHYFDMSGEVETWMGICHGWAPASYMTDRPLKKITVMASDGKTPVNFYPSDIKALASLLWAKVNTPSRFIGGRCNDENPKLDENGRPVSQSCQDTNPGTWHMSVVNKIGVEKKSFVMDANFDYEVWNQPVLAYSYSYFNVESKAPGKKLSEAVIPLSEYKSDHYKKFRSPLAKKVVGITMEVTYLSETFPAHREVDEPAMDDSRSVMYIYDLELDQDDNIVGGEWYQNAHPDFLWTPVGGSRPLTMEDYALLGEAKWDGKKPLEKVWTEKGNQAARKGKPLFKIVESLIELTKKP